MISAIHSVHLAEIMTSQIGSCQRHASNYDLLLSQRTDGRTDRLSVNIIRLIAAGCVCHFDSSLMALHAVVIADVKPNIVNFVFTYIR